MSSSAAPAVSINAVSTLAEAYPDRDDAAAKPERKWKRYLFYILGYCDTFHDFADARNTVGEGTSLKLGVKGSIRSDYIIRNIINTMDPSINFTEIYNEIGGDSTFEKSMYATFTDLVGNPLINKLDPAYRTAITTHLSNIHNIPTGYSFQNTEIKDGDKYFSTATAAASAAGGGGPTAIFIPDSSIIEIRIPAKVYPDTWQKNFIDFLHNLFPSCGFDDTTLGKRRLRIVEDTATFPRELFTNHPTNFERFQKLDIPQTRWDPAGLTNFNDKTMANLKRQIDNVSASSFRSLKPFSETPTEQYPKNAAYFIQNTDIDSLILEGQVPNRIDNLQRGPSVNHLFMHLIVHSDLTPISKALGAKTPPAIAAKSEKIKRDATRLINAANNPLKGKKSTTLKLIAPVADNARNAELLRKYTTSKRTGDYENTNAAKYHNAVLFCGDEPEFVYAMLNEQPAIYHTHEAAGHKFRINVSNFSGISDNELIKRKNEQTVINYLHKAFEVTRLFTNVKKFVLDYFENINMVFSKHIDITWFPTNLFKYIIRKFILSNQSVITDLYTSCQSFKKLNATIQERLTRYNIHEIKQEDYIAIKSHLLEIVKNQAELLGIQAEITKLDIPLKKILKNIPRSLNISETSATPNKPYLFREVKQGIPLVSTYENDDEEDDDDEDNEVINWIIDTALFPTLNSLNEIIPELSDDILSIVLYSKEPIARSTQVLIKRRKKEINNKLRGFGIEEDFFEKTDAYKDAAYTTAETEFNQLIAKFKSQEGGFTHATHTTHTPTKHRTYTRRVKVHGKKHVEHKGSRSRSRSKHKHKKSSEIDADILDKMSSTELYKYTKESIMKLGKAPFGLTGEEYANQIVFRMMIIDSIHEIIGKPTVEEEPVAVPVKVSKHSLEDVSNNDEPTEIMTVKKTRVHSHKADQQMVEELVQSGGALSDEESLIWYRIYIDMVIPLWDSLHRNAPFTPAQSILISIIDGSFLQLVMPLLEKISTMKKGKNDHIDNIIESSKETLRIINQLIDFSFNDQYYIFVTKKLEAGTYGFSGVELNGLIDTGEKLFFEINADGYIVKDRFLTDLNIYINFLNKIIKKKKRGTAWQENDETVFYAKMVEIARLNTPEEYKSYMTPQLDYMNNNIRYAFQSHFNLFYLDDNVEGFAFVTPEAVAAANPAAAAAEAAAAAAEAEAEAAAAGGQSSAANPEEAIIAGAGDEDEGEDEEGAAAAPAPGGGSGSSKAGGGATQYQGGGRRIIGHERKKGKRRSSPRRLSIKNR
jgi:hypothetical protein